MEGKQCILKSKPPTHQATTSLLLWSIHATQTEIRFLRSALDGTTENPTRKTRIFSVANFLPHMNYESAEGKYMNPTDFITCELFYKEESYGHVTWCPYCQNGFSNDDNKTKCPIVGERSNAKPPNNRAVFFFPLGTIYRGAFLCPKTPTPRISHLNAL